MRILRLGVLGALLCSTVTLTSGCATAVVAGVAAAGGYIAHKEGVRVRSPITKR